ncbi:M20 aminoacylase family protein [Ancylobacter polymorphus]|uniref:Hippurate hydrolase n=1 Tax=Ancylobacter polymorphus TaxID=223390 RepID=A0ABU0BC37_9HYPH|nr:M20 aminoacylase family protein [Ancylobacter polymorphus]MDQ0302049.1 hippurate hydrolase [Ancylobacter polymorphus]
MVQKATGDGSGILPDLAAQADELSHWRRTLHAMPETAFEEHRTSAFVAEKLASFGLPVQRGLAGTGLVATLKGQLGDGPAIGLRADMDALDIHEATNLPWRSDTPAKMHACGHDGHMTMLLAAARHLSQKPDFAGTVHFIFQPAEENEGGGKVMVEQGLFDRFPMQAVYGLHNWPNAPFGTFLGRPGAMFAAFDIFEVKVIGRGAHAAMPQRGIDPVLTAAHIVTQLQAIVARAVNPQEAAVVSVTQIHGGDTWNVIPDEVVLRGTVRSFAPAVRDLVEARLRAIVDGVCAAQGARADIRYERRYPPLVNHDAAFGDALAAARATVGDQVDPAFEPIMAAEDFAYMLEAVPGAYLCLASGPGPNLHNAAYDFNDALLPVGASYWVHLVRQRLAPAARNGRAGESVGE